MNTEVIVYLLRKTSLNREDIGKLSPAQLNAIINEVYYQESVTEYRNQYAVASIMAAIYNTIPRKRGSKTFKASDFLKGDMPERHPKLPGTLEELANRHNVELPTKELKKRG